MDKKSILDEINKYSTSVEKGRAFLELCTKELFSDLDINYIDGSGDGGIDAFCITNNVEDGFDSVDRFLIIQSKFGESFAGPDTIRSEFSKIIENFENKDFLGKGDVFDTLRKFVKYDKRVRKPQIKVIFLTSRPMSVSERSVLRAQQKTLEKAFSGVDVSCENFDLDCIFTDRVDIGKYKVKLLDFSVSCGCLTGKISVEEIVRLYNNVENKTGNNKVLFSKNFRQSLGDKGKINKSIKSTVVDNPRFFGPFNNGIKMITNGLEIDTESNSVYVNCPSIINGCQTTNMIVEACKLLMDIQGNTIDELNTGAWVTISIIDVSSMSEKDIEKITSASNLQNKVKATDVSNAQNSVAQEVRRVLIEDYNLYTDVKRDQTLADPSIPKEIKETVRILKLEDAISCIVSTVFGRTDYSAHQKALACFDGLHGSKALDLSYRFPYIAEFSYYLELSRQRLYKYSRKILSTSSAGSAFRLLGVYFNIMKQIFENYWNDRRSKEEFEVAISASDERERSVTKEFCNFYKAIINNDFLDDHISIMAGEIFKKYISVSCREEKIFKDFGNEERDINKALNTVNMNTAKILKNDIYNEVKSLDSKIEREIKKIIKSIKESKKED
jgi:hypothetical protein